MTFRSLLYLIPALLITTACGSTQQFTPQQLDRDLTIDGSLSDWNTGEALIESRDQASYYAAYDEQFLYIYVDIKAPSKDQAIRRSGFIIYLSDDEDSRRKTGIGFPPGTFNLLRENPGVFNDFVRDDEWMSSPANQEMLQNLEEELFDRVMIVERSNGSSSPEHGFVDVSRLEVDGLEIAADTDGRHISLELKVPRDGSSIYEFSGNSVWLGFAIEPPEFRFRNESSYSASQDRRGRYGNRQRQQQQQPRQNISRSLGALERWYKLNMDTP
jgi:hypothetical protein